MGLDQSGGSDRQIIHRYEVVFKTREGIPSSYKGVKNWPLHTADGFIKIELSERTVYIHVTDDLVSYSVRELDVSKPDKTVRELPIQYAPHRPDATPADDFPQAGGTGGGESA